MNTALNVSQNLFFSDPKNHADLQNFAQFLERNKKTTDETQVADLLHHIVKNMVTNADQFDQFCGVNIESIGSNFMGAVRQENQSVVSGEPASMARILSMAYRFLCELEFVRPGDSSSNMVAINDAIDQSVARGEIIGIDYEQIIYARMQMPIRIAKILLNNPGIVEFQKFSQTVKAAEQLKTDWDTELNTRKNHLESIKQGLKDATSSYNFVGLVDGFRHMADNKKKELRTAYKTLRVLAILMIIPPAAQVIYVVTHIESLTLQKELLLYTLPAILAIEVILVYLFRVVLAQFRSVKAQVLQIDLRIALCQFVQSYAEYATKIKKEDASILAKFESVVFSNLVPDSENIPSTFDGTEQLANLIKSVRGT